MTIHSKEYLLSQDDVMARSYSMICSGRWSKSHTTRTDQWRWYVQGPKVGVKDRAGWDGERRSNAVIESADGRTEGTCLESKCLSSVFIDEWNNLQMKLFL